MGIKEMLPYRDEIVALKELSTPKTHEDVIAYLDSRYGVKVSKPTVTRFLRLHAPHLVNSRHLTEEEEKAAVPYEAVVRIEANIIAMREELGLQIDTLTERTGGKLAVLSADIVELEKTILHLKQEQSLFAVPEQGQSVSPHLLRRIWLRALAFSAIGCAILFILAWFILKG